MIEKLKLKKYHFSRFVHWWIVCSLALEKGVKSQGLVLINTLRKNNSRLKWINETMVNVARYGGTSLLMDMNMPVIASPSFLDKMKPNALNPNNYKGLEENSWYFQIMKGSLTANWDIDWSKIDLPVLIMTGHHDKVFRIADDIDQIANSMKNVQRLEFPDCGHLIPLEKPKEFAFHLNEFAKKLI